MKTSCKCTRPKYVCANEFLKLIGATDGGFPDFGHHLEKEMGGLWMYPVKLLDGFWMKISDEEIPEVDTWMFADQFDNYPHKNVFSYGMGMGHTPITAKRTQIAPDGIRGIRVTYEFTLPQGQKKREVKLEFLARTDLRPDWLAEEMGIFDGDTDHLCWDAEENAFLGTDSENPWCVMIGCSEPVTEHEIGDMFGPEVTSGKGKTGVIRFSFPLSPGETRKLEIYIAGAANGEQSCRENYRRLKAAVGCEQEKKARIDRLVQASKLTVPEPGFSEIFDWVKVHTDWLTLEADGIGRGVTAGIPEYVWYFGCDSCYALQGMMMQGNFEICKSTILLLLKYSAHYNGNGRIIHEILPNGFSPNFGNVQETAHFLYLLWEYYQWTGDRETLEESFSYITKSVRWLAEMDDDQDGFPTGYGIIEIAGLNMEMVDTAAYTACAYGCYAKICQVLGHTENVPYWEEMEQKTAKAVRDHFWSEEEGLFCDCFASARKIEEKKDMVIAQMQEAQAEDEIIKLEKALECEDKETERGWLLNKNWVINVPLETGIADKKQAERALERLNTREFIGPYGMYLEGLRKNTAMTISTGVMAVAQARYGYADRALDLAERIMGTFSMATPGSISEMSPDHGCFVQAWTAYGIMVPVVRYFFGIEPDARNHVITISPNLPEKWGGQASLEDVRVLDGTVSVFIEDKDGKSICTVKNHTSAQIRCKAYQGKAMEFCVVGRKPSTECKAWE